MTMDSTSSERSQCQAPNAGLEQGSAQLSSVLTVYGVVVLSFMMLMYAFEHRGSGYVLAFAIGCALSSFYGFASGTWPFGVVEAIWCAVSVRRFRVALGR
jgi:hypothetical protein